MDKVGTAHRADDAWRLHQCGALSTPQAIDERTYWLPTASPVALQIRVWSAHIVQLTWQLWQKPHNAHFSYALDPNHPFDSCPPHQWMEDPLFWTLHTEQLRLFLRKQDGYFRLEDASGHVVFEAAEPGFACRETILSGLSEWQLHLHAPKGCHYHGLGDKAGRLNMKGQRYTLWNTDTFMYGTDTDPLYKSIPFFIRIHKGLSAGFFLDNSYQSWFDFEKSQAGRICIRTAGGPLSCFLINGPAYLDVCRRYAALTGKTPLPPIWALGFHQCRWSYFPESRVKEVAATFRDLDIPCDAIWLDIDYMDGYRCFTWNLDYFPDPKGMIEWLRKKGFHTVVMIDPGIRIDEQYFVFQHGTDYDVWCKRSNGEWMIAPVWPPDCVFPDFTHPHVRQWWGKLYRNLYLHQQVDGFWNDMNEPAIFKVHRKTFPDNVIHHYEGHLTDHRQAHNVYGQQMSRATFEGLRQLKPHQRPFVLTRATFAGGQRYAAVWTGDNIANWEHLAIALRQTLRLSISGFSFAGSDIGGFAGQPDGELMIRWLQLGVFHPLFRVHSIGNHTDGDAAQDDQALQAPPPEDRMDQEPWAFGEPWTNLARKAIQWRYRLLPYLYSAFWRHQRDGTPVLLPLCALWPEDKRAIKIEEAFMLGEHLLIWPILRPGQKTKSIYLPQGKWYDWTSGKIYQAGAHRLRVHLDRIPAFARAGSVIPLYPVRPHTSAPLPHPPALRIFPGQSYLPTYWYEDAGDGYDHLQGTYRLAKYRLQQHPHQLVLTQEIEGQFQPTWSEITLEWVLPAHAQVRCKIDGQEVHATFVAPNSSWHVKAPYNFRQALCSFVST